MEVKDILLWGGFILICAVIFFLSRRMKKQIEENGIEVDAVISRITDDGAPDEIDLHYYARYVTAEGEEVEGLLANPTADLTEGQTVRVKYHPKYKANARLIR